MSLVKRPESIYLFKKHPLWYTYNFCKDEGIQLQEANAYQLQNLFFTPFDKKFQWLYAYKIKNAFKSFEVMYILLCLLFI